MPEAFSLGPMIVPTLRVGTLIALILASVFATRLADRRDLAAAWTATTSEWAIWLGLAAARLGFVLDNWRAYQDAPWTALYLWQPGYSLTVGVIVGGTYLLWRVWRRPPAERSDHLRVLGAGFGLAVLLVGALTLSTRLDLGTEALRTGDAVPDFRLQDLQGEPVAFADLEGKVVVLNFWATWCPPCRREMPMLDAMNRAYADQGAVIVGVDVGEHPDTVRRFVDTIGVDYPIWTDGPQGAGYDSTEALYRRFGGVGLPTTVFIDGGGVLRAFRVGELSAGVVQDQIEALTKRGAVAPRK